MLERLDYVFARLRVANLKLKPSKCCLFREQVVFLGHKVSAESVATDPQKIQRVQEWPTPQNMDEVRQFVGEAVWLLIKGTRRVRNRKRKFLPSFEGP